MRLHRSDMPVGCARHAQTSMKGPSLSLWLSQRPLLIHVHHPRHDQREFLLRKGEAETMHREFLLRNRRDRCKTSGEEGHASDANRTVRASCT